MSQIEVREETAPKIALMLLQIGAVRFSITKPFTWSSGWKSPIYCDNRLALSYPDVRTAIKDGLAMVVKESFPDAEGIAGVATAGIPQGALVADALRLPFLYVRSKPKDHGLQNLIEGRLVKGQRIAVIEDLVSTGQSSLVAVEALRKAGAKPVGVAAIFNYGLDIATENFTNAKVPLVSLSDYAALLRSALEQHHINKEEMITLKAWRTDPGNWMK